MNDRMRGIRWPIAGAPVASIAFFALAAAAAFGELAFEPSWKAPTYDKVRDDVIAWLDDADAPASAIDGARLLWPEQPDAASVGPDLLDRLADTFAAVDARSAKLVEACREGYRMPRTPSADWLSEGASPLVRNNLRLYYARWLAQHKLYDEALEALADLTPADVVDPASLLFYRMTACHQLVRPDEARAALAQLLERKEALPERFQQVAQLVETDLNGLADESLAHIARRMSDIRRRLAYGRAGQRVQSVEQGVLESLDKKINQLEQQQKQQQSAQSQSGGQMQPASPMQDSRLPGFKAPMQVDQRDIGRKSGWGDMPPKQREQALQQIGRDFPAHYRDIIEQYFRELAAESPASN